MKQVLVVDDEPSSCAYLKDVCEYFGFGVTLAHSCRDALALLEAQPFAAVLVDLYLQHETGDFILRWLRAQDRTEPVIMMCSMPHYELRIDMIFKGAVELLGKPVQPMQLRQVLLQATSPVERPAVGHQDPERRSQPALSH